jgi:hypothetical protein
VTTICIVIQSPEFVSSAGMRIRYLRLASAAPLGTTITYAPIAELLQTKTFDAEIYIFSKTFMPEALILACHLKKIGKIVGQDFFDDYFSQTDDARLARFQCWVREMEPFTDFVLGTTERLTSVIAEYMPRAPITIVPDPIEAFDRSDLAHRVSDKIRTASASRKLSIYWFGIGDNPFFSVGVRDLVAYGGDLARFKALGWDATLTVLTNTRALSSEGLALLRTLPIDFRIMEWTEAREDESLKAADLAFIPVGGQGFSRAKSLNRCLTALLRGCQVLSRGYPLYRSLGEFVYRSADDLVADLELGEVKLRGSQLPRLYELLDAHASPAEAAATFGSAATSRPMRPSEKDSSRGAGPPLCLVHGRNSDTSIHKLAARFGGLSVRSPFHEKTLNYQLRFDPVGGELRCRIEKSRMKFLDPDVATAAIDVGRIMDLEFFELPLSRIMGWNDPFPLAMGSDRFSWLAVYPSVIEVIRTACQRLFPSASVIVSEQHQLALATMHSAAYPRATTAIRSGVA